VTRTEEFAPAFERAVASNRPALLHVHIDPEALTLNASLTALRTQGQAAQRS
jgi:acetolactate synthase-1/2/3 large subunit